MNIDKTNYFIIDWIENMKETVKLTYPSLSDKEITDYLYEIIEKELKVPIANLDNNYTGKNKNVDVLTLLQWIKNNEFIIAGNGTIFKNQNQEYNPTIHMLMDLKNKRSRIKKERDNLNPDSYEYLVKDIQQGTCKRAMNSDYGGSGSDITYFYNLYCAVSTTATGQSLISTAMCTFENFFSDNVKFIDYDDFVLYVNNILKEEYTLDTSFLGNKTVKEVYNRLKNKFINYKEIYDFPICNILKNLNQMELNLLYYKNNLYEFSKLPKIKKMLFNMIDKVDRFLNPNKVPDIIKKDLEELWRYYDEFVVYNYFAFDRIGRLTCDTRDTVCTIDTDSNMLTLYEWVSFVEDEIIENDVKLLSKGNDLIYIIINIICYIITQLISKHLEKYAETSGILDEYAPYLNMKNELLFYKMLLTETKKRYMGKILLREGNEYHKIDSKGVDHTKSTCNEYTRNFITNLIGDEILENTNDDINIKVIINSIDNFAKEIRYSLEKREKTFLSPMKVKEAKAYKMPFQEQAFRGAYAWNLIYPDQNIEFPDNIDIVHLKIPTLEVIEDMKETYPKEYENIKRYIFESKIEEVRKKGLMVLAIPKNIDLIPEWCEKYIDYDKIINSNTSKMNPILESLGIKTINTDSKTTYYSNLIEF